MRDLSRHQVWGQSLALLTTAILAFHLIYSSAIAQQHHILRQPPVDMPVTAPPTQGRLLPGGKVPTNQGPASIKMTGTSDRGRSSNPNNNHSYSRSRAVEREVAGRVAVGSAVLVLPTVAYFGVPIILDVPDLGYVELSEQRYAE